ncbi:MAG: glutamate mutase L [Armatimonadota bacterium]|nr:glutamate mutase L [Armatimonadota bacterium]
MGIERIVATDCGSTTTKAILIEKVDNSYRLISRGEAPTTVEAPFDDVTIGVLNAVGELEEVTGRDLLNERKVFVRSQDSGSKGADLYVSTSSAGGGLQMMVMGVVKKMTGESAQRAALGAGAIVMDVIAIDDGRKDYERIQRIRSLRPDMVLLAGGTDGGTITHVVELAELLLSADPKPRLGIGYRLPVIFAGNRDARDSIRSLLGSAFDLRIVDNIRPVLDRENLGPAREAIHQLFLEHVMQQAPGYNKLIEWVSAPIMPTPMAVGKLVEEVARSEEINVLAVDIGGATTDIFSVFNNVFNRTVSANLGMSYSIGNVLAETGIENIRRWLPFDMSEAELRKRLRNKMVRPTTVPQTLDDLLMEQAVAREALRLSLEHHKQLAVTLRGVHIQRTVGEILTAEVSGQTIVDMMVVDLLIGSGGVLSHAPRRHQAALMLLDAWQPEGFTRLTVDSIFMMPHLGVLSTVEPAIATEVFWRDCLIPLGWALAPSGTGKTGDVVGNLYISGKRYNIGPEKVLLGTISLFPVDPEEEVLVRFEPTKGFDAGAGRGKTVERMVSGGVVGLIVDARGRPLTLPPNPSERAEKMRNWLVSSGSYTAQELRSVATLFAS